MTQSRQATQFKTLHVKGDPAGFHFADRQMHRGVGGFAGERGLRRGICRKPRKPCGECDAACRGGAQSFRMTALFWRVVLSV